MAFERWQQQLFELLHEIQNKQQQFDQATNACQVLLRPWPKKAQENEEAKSYSSDNNNENVVAAGRWVDPVEEAELKLVNDLLSKAQKTRDKASSKKVDKERKLVDTVVTSSRNEKQTWEVCESEPQTGQTSSAKRAVPSADLAEVPVSEAGDLPYRSGSAHSDGSVQEVHSKQQQKKHVKGGSGLKSHGGVDLRDKNHRSATSLTKNAPGAVVKRSKGLENVENSHFRPKSGAGKIKPAHVTAPFKTDPTLHVPKRPVKKNLHPIPQQRSNLGHIHSRDSSYQNKVIPPIVLGKEKTLSLIPDNLNDNSHQDICDLQSLHEEAQATPIPSTCVDPAEVVTARVSNLTLQTDSVSSGNESEYTKNQLSVVSRQQAEDKESKLFSLLTNGPSINIPPKVRRAFAKNQQLRRKVLQQDIGRKKRSDSYQVGQVFADKLEELFDTEEELLYRQQAIECLHTHSQLVELLKELDLDQLSEVSSPQEILRAKMLAEFVLASFSAYSEDVSLLSKVQFPDTLAVSQPSHIPSALSHVWLPVHMRGPNCDMANIKLQYTSKEDLSRYMDSMLKVQILQCQRHILDLLTADILPWLLKLDPSDWMVCHRIGNPFALYQINWALCRRAIPLSLPQSPHMIPICQRGPEVRASMCVIHLHRHVAHSSSNKMNFYMCAKFFMHTFTPGTSVLSLILWSIWV